MRRLATVGIFFAIGGLPKPALANVPTVAIDAIKLEGNEFEVTVNIFHKGNNIFHYVDKVVLFADGEEVKVWKYSWRRRPESENFSVVLRTPRACGLPGGHPSGDHADISESVLFEDNCCHTGMLSTSSYLDLTSGEGIWTAPSI